MSDSLSSDLASLRIDRRAGPPRRGFAAFRGIAIALAVLALLVAGGFLAWPYLEARVFKTEVKVTQIARVSPIAASTALTAAGYVVPEVISRISSKVPGRVGKVFVKEGDRVEKDQVLVELEATEQRSQLSQALARLAAAQARAATAQANVAEVRQQLDREQMLAQRGAAARSTIEDLQARAESVRAAWNAATAEVKVAQSDVAAAQAALDLMTIRSPIAGTVIHKPMEVGEVVGSFTATGASISLVDVADLESSRVEADVPEARLYLVKPGAPCEIVLDAFPGRRFQGEVVEFGKQVDRAKATLTVKVRFADSKAGVLPDMSARVSFLTERPTAAQLRATERTVVPATALATRVGKQGVLIVDEGGRLRWQTVRLGEAMGDGFIMLAGPAPGTKIVDRPAPTLNEGMNIREKSDR